MSNLSVMGGLIRDQRAWVKRKRVEAVVLVVRASTEGFGRAPGAPIDTGELRKSMTVQGDNTPNLVSVAALIVSIPLGVTIVYGWQADHAGIIELGRRPDAQGVIRGSLQAPGGFFLIALDVVAAEMGGRL